MKQIKRNEITRAVEEWRAKQPRPWMSIKWPPLLPHSYEPIWLVDYEWLPTYRSTPYEFETTCGGPS